MGRLDCFGADNSHYRGGCWLDAETKAVASASTDIAAVVFLFLFLCFFSNKPEVSVLVLYSLCCWDLLGGFHGCHFVDEVGSLNKLSGCVPSREHHLRAFGYEVKKGKHVIDV